uniref:N/A n=1 Tax=Ganoderma boninense TaxID=34458 RepID=A0A5K1K6C0_9APHY|nr:N/A [Ganoderma boninense]
MFSAFGIGPKPFDLAAALASWSTSAPDQPPTPEFKGKPRRKDDPTAEAWLDLIEQGCTARRVPKTHWPDVAKHFMGKKPRGRVAEVEKVMHALHGEQWAWMWKNFRVAVLNMGSEDRGQGRLSLSLPKEHPRGRQAEPAQTFPALAQIHPPPQGERERGREAAEKDETTKSKEPKPPNPPAPPRSSLLFTLPALPGIPGLRRAPAQAEPQTLLAKVSAQVPLWLLATTEALATLANDNPDMLTAVATVLVAVGTVSGGGTAAVAAIGEAAIVVGRAIKSAHDRVHGR